MNKSKTITMFCVSFFALLNALNASSLVLIANDASDEQIEQAKDILQTPTITALNIPYKSAYQLEQTTQSSSNDTLIITKYLFDEDSYTLYNLDYSIVFDEAFGDEKTCEYFYSFKNDENQINQFTTEISTQEDYDFSAFSYNNERITTYQSCDINQSFIGLTTNCDESSGGAIYLNDSKDTLANIYGDFVVNYVENDEENVSGGAIFISNEASIKSITGSFIGNYVYSNQYSGFGGAIYNDTGTIGDIIGNFIANYSYSESGGSYGGAIYNLSGTIGNIIGDFIANWSYANENKKTYSYSYAGAIYNKGIIGDITGDFSSNCATSNSNTSAGGAIYNYGTIGDIIGDFSSNYLIGLNATGGAIYNAGIIESITGDFIANYSSATSGASSGGAIYNLNGTIGDISGNFIGNIASANSSSAYAGAIYNNDGSIRLLALENDMQFTGNSTNNSSLSDNGIYNTSYASGDGASIFFNAFNDKTITVNDAINGSYYYRDKQTLEINSSSLDEYEEAKTYSSVIFNNSVYNQTVNVYNGVLEFGSFAGTTLEINSTNMEVSASIGSIGNSYLNVYVNGYVLANADAFKSSSYYTNTIVNNGTIGLTGGTLSNDISGTGTIEILDDVTLNANISGDTLIFTGNTIDDATSLTYDNTSYTVKFDEVLLELSEAFTANAGDALLFISGEDTIVLSSLRVTYNGSELIEGTHYSLYSTAQSSSTISTLALTTNSLTDSQVGVQFLQAVPEPFTCSLLAGLFSLGFAYLKKKK